MKESDDFDRECTSEINRVPHPTSRKSTVILALLSPGTVKRTVAHYCGVVEQLRGKLSELFMSRNLSRE